MFKSAWIIAFNLFFLTNAWAIGSGLKDCQVLLTHKLAREVIKKFEKTDEELKLVKKTLRQSLKIIDPTLFQTPQVISINLYRGPGQPYFDYNYKNGTGKIQMMNWLLKTEGRRKETADAILAHEFGHQLFFENIGLKNGSFSKEWKKHPRRTLLYQSLPYQELFSDLLAVLALDNPGTMARAMTMINVGATSKYRDFENNFFPDSEDPILSEEILVSEHSDLAAVRGFIGREYLPKLKTLRQKQELLAGVFQAISDEINQRFEKIRRNRLDKMPLSVVNERLILRISKIIKL